MVRLHAWWHHYRGRARPFLPDLYGPLHAGVCHGRDECAAATLGEAARAVGLGGTRGDVWHYWRFFALCRGLGGSLRSPRLRWGAGGGGAATLWPLAARGGGPGAGGLRPVLSVPGALPPRG